MPHQRFQRFDLLLAQKFSFNFQGILSVNLAISNPYWMSFADHVDQDQTAQNYSLILGLYNPLPDKFSLTLSQTSPGFYVSAVQVFFKTLRGKGEIACNEQFLLYPLCFLPV